MLLFSTWVFSQLRGRGLPAGCALHHSGRTQNTSGATWLAGCRQLVLCPLQGSGIYLARFRGSTGGSGSICFPTSLNESRPPTLTLGAAQPCWGPLILKQLGDTMRFPLPRVVFCPGSDPIEMALWAELWEGLKLSRRLKRSPKSCQVCFSQLPWPLPAAARPLGRRLQDFGL